MNEYTEQKPAYSNSQYGNSSSNYSANRNNYSGGHGNYNRKDKVFDKNAVRLYKAYYASGNRDAPDHILAKVNQLAKDLDEFGYTLRHGSMDGIEVAMEAGAKHKELHVPFLPWKEFDKKQVASYFNTDEVKALAEMFHPTWDGLKPVIQAFLSKNVRGILGKDLKSPVRFIVCWSEDGAEFSNEKTNKTGSVGHIIALASALKIPVFNYGKPDADTRLRQFLGMI